MFMPFSVWSNPAPAKIHIIKFKHQIYYRLEQCYVTLKKSILDDIDPISDVIFLLNAIREILYINYTQPLSNWMLAISFDIDKLGSALVRAADAYSEVCNTCSEVENLLDKLKTNPSTPVLSALEEIFLADVLSQLKNKDQYVFGVRFSSRTSGITTAIENNGLSDFCTVSYWKDIAKQGTCNPLILAGPIAWHKSLLIVPPAKNIVIIQPSWHSSYLIKPDLFSNEYSSFGLPTDAVAPTDKPITLSLYEEHDTYTNQNNDLELSLDEVIESPLSFFQEKKCFNTDKENISIKVEHGMLNLKIGEKYLILRKDKSISYEKLITPDQLEEGDFLIDIIEGVEVVSEYDQDWQEIMEEWKKPLRSLESQPYLLAQRLKALGADEKANEENVKNWMKKSTSKTFAPQDLGRNFKAILNYARIPEERHHHFIELISSIRGTNRVSGRRVATEYYSNAQLEIEEAVSDKSFDDIIDSEISTDNYLFLLRKIIDIDFYWTHPDIAQKN